MLLVALFACNSEPTERKIDQSRESSIARETKQVPEKKESDKQTEDIKFAPYDLTEWPLNWTRLTKTDSTAIIFESCDGGNMLITVNPIDSLILFHGQQEDITYQYLESRISTDSTIHFIFGEDRIKDSFSFSWIWINKDEGVGIWDLSPYCLGNEQHEYNFVSKAQ